MLTQQLDQIHNDAGIRFLITNKPGFVIQLVLPYIFGIAGIILILNIIFSGYQMMTSAGDPKAMQAAQSKITTSLIGIIIIFISFWLVTLLMKFFGITFTTPIIN